MNEFTVDTNRVDAAFYLYRNDRFYLTTGNSIWEVALDTNFARLTTGKPQSKNELAELKDLPNFTAAVRWINDKIYFFEKTTYYRLERWLWFLKVSGPKNTARYWFGCINQD
ncbi:uncharacterized protein LOC121368757 [Gigantopelta aegis]|uniref:uncharacterized protein LOC121368757 n=1 Tax=Gigantopelta aegis TaxID=1735272 RepID=UPI001B8892FC|nr:uncharacterized protein LOC121368757 [Gigantopelta aegis]